VHHTKDKKAWQQIFSRWVKIFCGIVKRLPKIFGFSLKLL
jgi:hypothetical protein